MIGEEDSNMRDGKSSLLKKCIAALPALFVMGMIFYFSSKTSQQSTEQSQAVSEGILHVSHLLAYFGVPEGAIPEVAEIIEVGIRKIGHFSEFAILGAVLYYAFSAWTLTWRCRAMLTGIVGVLYAASDEIHQMFVPGRGPAVYDVLIDAAGIGTALCLIFIFGYKRTSERR